MGIDCVFFGPFRDAVGEKTLRLETDAETIGDLLADLEDRYPALDGRLLSGAKVVPEIAVTINGRHVQHVDGVRTALADGDIVRLTPAVYGG
jgi:molybdopterin synthase sulfur carrier subunit